jgi:hypothetical protein
VFASGNSHASLIESLAPARFVDVSPPSQLNRFTTGRPRPHAERPRGGGAGERIERDRVLAVAESDVAVRRVVPRRVADADERRHAVPTAAEVAGVRPSDPLHAEVGERQRLALREIDGQDERVACFANSLRFGHRRSAASAVSSARRWA